MRGLAAVGLCHRLDISGPAPAWLGRDAHHGHVAEIDDVRGCGAPWPVLTGCVSSRAAQPGYCASAMARSRMAASKYSRLPLTLPTTTLLPSTNSRLILAAGTSTVWLPPVTLASTSTPFLPSASIASNTIG